eukprot:c18992_g1_i1 orf=806-2257(-)
MPSTIAADNIRPPDYTVSDCSIYAHTLNQPEYVLMGNAMAEVLTSQLLGGNINHTSQEEINLPNANTCSLELPQNFAFLRMLEGIIMLDEGTHSSNCYYSKLPSLLEQKDQEKILNMPVIQTKLEPETVALDFYGDFGLSSDETSQQDLQINVQTVAAPTAKDSYVAERCRSSQSSEAYKSIVPSEPVVDTHDSQFNCSPGIFEDGTSSQGPKSSVSGSCSENFMNVPQDPSNLPRLTEQVVDWLRPWSDDSPDRKKRKRSRGCKNSQEVESQRMTHIAVERNRRKQMNEHLRVLRSLMPGSYIQRGDQASIIGGAIEFVKELEQVLLALQERKNRMEFDHRNFSPESGNLLRDFVWSPALNYNTTESDSKYMRERENCLEPPFRELFAESKSPVADIQVKMCGSDAVLKVLSQKRPGQLLKTMAAIENLDLRIMQLNITTIEQAVLYSFTVKVGTECQLETVRDMAISIQHIFDMIYADSLE